MDITNSKQAKQLLKGKKIVNVEMNAFRDGRGGWATRPVITFEDGSFILFVTQETETGDYGVALVHGPPRKEKSWNSTRLNRPQPAAGNSGCPRPSNRE